MNTGDNFKTAITTVKNNQKVIFEGETLKFKR